MNKNVIEMSNFYTKYLLPLFSLHFLLLLTNILIDYKYIVDSSITEHIQLSETFTLYN